MKKIYLLGFIAISLAATYVKFTPVLVGKLNFTLFDLYAPAAGGFFGPIIGAIAVLAVGLVKLLIGQSFGQASILHLFPVLFGALYFGLNKKYFNIAIPAIAIIGFLSFPNGREVWYYPMLWLIPIITSFYKEKSVAANALGATFTTHAVGGLLWIYFFNPPASVWSTLFPIVIIERSIFAITTVVVYLLVKKAHEIYQSQNAAAPSAER